MLNVYQKRLKAYGMIALKKKRIFLKEKTVIKKVEPKPKFEPVSEPEWKPQEGVRLLIVPPPKDLWYTASMLEHLFGIYEKSIQNGSPQEKEQAIEDAFESFQEEAITRVQYEQLLALYSSLAWNL